MTMRSAVVFAAFSVVLPASVHSQVVRNAYSEANFLGATTFLKFIDKAGLSTLLKDPRENLTVFAPTEVAFEQLSPAVRKSLDTNVTFLGQLLRFHLVKGLHALNTNNAVFLTMSARPCRVNVYTDVPNPNLTTVSGSPVLLSNSPATNGVVNMLTRLMYPLPAGTALDYVGDSSFSMLLLALTKAGVTSLLNAADITHFAPTNSAFEKLPPGVFSDLLANISLLTKVLQNHLVSGVVYSAYVKAKGVVVLKAESGQKLNVTVAGNGTTLKVGTATVTSLDVNVNNGVIHVIDTVLLPPKLYRSLGRPSFRVV